VYVRVLVHIHGLPAQIREDSTVFMLGIILGDESTNSNSKFDVKTIYAVALC
jgi:hypothetical protein